MRILITGATGLVGSNLLMRLLGGGLAEDGVKIRATLYKDLPVVVDREIEYVHADLTKEEDCRNAVEGCDVVVHAAANTSGALIIQKTPMVHVTPNVVMNVFLLDAAYNAGVSKFIWFASTTGYPYSKDPMTEDRMFEGDPYSAYYFVGHMKRFTETLCKMYGEKLKKPMTTIVLRPTNIFGPCDDFELATSHVTASLIRKVVERHDPLVVWGTGKDLRDLVYVDDVTDAVMRAVTSERTGYNAYNIGSGKVHSVNSILKHILEIDGYADANVECDKTKPTTIPVRRVDVSKAKRELGFAVKTKLEDGLKKTLEWYRLNKMDVVI